MNIAGLNLLIPDKPDPERDAVAAEWERHGGVVVRLGRFWEPPALPANTIRVYGNEMFCLILREKLGLSLVTPADDQLLGVPAELLRRTIAKRKLGEADTFEFPTFAKTLVPKLIPSQVYATVADLRGATEGLEPGTELLLSQPVSFTAEVRTFVLDGRVLDAAAYENDASLVDARTIVERLVHSVTLPAAVVVDVGLLADGTWAVIELNAAWGAGLNGCDAARVLPAIAAASNPDAALGSSVEATD